LVKECQTVVPDRKNTPIFHFQISFLINLNEKKITKTDSDLLIGGKTWFSPYEKTFRPTVLEPARIRTHGSSDREKPEENL
jgi:hypothetical protein